MGSIFDRKIVRVPVKMVNGVCEYFYGGVLPIKENAVADLVIDENLITDKCLLKALKQKTTHRILEQGVPILVALTIKPDFELADGLQSHLIERGSKEIELDSEYFYSLRSQDTQFLLVTIGGPTQQQLAGDQNAKGGVWLDLQGLQPKGIRSSTVCLPEEVSKQPAVSLNHAFTLLSNAYEPWRISHTGNIYERMLYKEKNNKWYPLEVLRNRAIVNEEHILIRDQWKMIRRDLGIEDLFNSQDNSD